MHEPAKGMERAFNKIPKLIAETVLKLCYLLLLVDLIRNLTLSGLYVNKTKTRTVLATSSKYGNV